jgi:hypothetical protein
MTTTEIDKQLAAKADKYIIDKSKELAKVFDSVTNYLDYEPSFINYCSDISNYKEKRNWAYCNKYELEDKFRKELENNFKNRLVRKFTKELLTKIDLLK